MAPEEAGDLVAYFGYGSLVNRATHRTQIISAVPARLKGWRRVWRARPDMPGFPAALLSIRRDPEAVTDGLLVFDRPEHLAAVDVREARYNRIALAPEELLLDHPLPENCRAYVYVAQEDIPPHPEPPLILRSYLDAVLQGFLEVHGEEGVRRFVAETEGFEFGFHDDRAGPLYPRAVSLNAGEADFFEMLLSGTAVRIRPQSGVE